VDNGNLKLFNHSKKNQLKPRIQGYRCKSKMKKHFILVLSCVVLIISGVAQPKMQIHKGTDWWEPDTIYTQDLAGYYERIIFSYENDLCVSKLYQQNWGSSEWNTRRILIYTYDNQNNILSELEQYLGWQGEWYNTYKTTYTYNVQNNMISKLRQHWSSEQWDNYTKHTYTYDTHNNMTLELRQEWDGQWKNSERYSYTYDTHNNMTSKIEEYVDWQGKWWNHIKWNYTYDPQNNMIEDLGQVWFSQLGQWVNAYRITYTYDMQNNRLTEFGQDFESGQWVNSDRTTYTYDTQNNMTSGLREHWLSGQWRNNLKFTYTYNENNNAIEGFCHEWKNNTWVEGSDYKFMAYYNNMKSYFRLGDSYHFTVSYVKTGTVSIQETPAIENTIKLYPNPVSNTLYIETGYSEINPEVKIYSIQGVLLIHTKGNQIDVSALASGIYIANINGMGKKIVKQ